MLSTKRKTRYKKTLRTKFRAHGGPYGGQLLSLTTPGTMPFKVGSFSGRYNSEMQWEAA
jgi:hypothetical protein